MTEQQWLVSTDVDLMMRTWRSQEPGVARGGRLMRLFAAGCCRRVWQFLDDDCRRAVEIGELYADRRSSLDAGLRSALLGRSIGDSAAFLCAGLLDVEDPCVGLHNLFHIPSTESPLCTAAVQADVLRDVVGNPFRGDYLIADEILNWRDGVVKKLARAIYEERCWGELGVLADALEDAGCVDAMVLRHLRGPGPHVRGCWVLDWAFGGRGR